MTSGTWPPKETSIKTRATHIAANTGTCRRRSIGSIRIGCRPPLAGLRVIDEVFDVIADVTSMLAVDRASALHPHLFQGVFGEPQPCCGFHRIQKRWLFRFFLLVNRHVGRSVSRG